MDSLLAIRDQLDSPENTLLGFQIWNTTECTSLIFYPEYQDVLRPSNAILSGIIYLLTLAVSYQLREQLTVKSACGKQIIKCMKIVYNIMQISVCSWMFYRFTPLWFSNFGIDHIQTREGEWAAIICYFSKILDFCDTFFMIITGNYRQITFLQVFHHATMPWHAANCIRCGWGRGVPLQSGWVNAFIHVQLYSHYLIRTLGFRNPFRSLITISQLSQFFYLCSRALLGIFYLPQVADFALQDILYQGFMFFLFYNFYQKDKKKKKNVKSD